MKLQISEIRPSIFHIVFDNQYSMASTMMRIQEFQESNLKGIQGRYFSVEDFMDKYAQSKGDQFSYFEEWIGFNVSGNKILRFYEVFQKDLLKKEKILFKCLSMFTNNFQDLDKFSVISTTNKDSGILEHEVAHAYWYLYPDYRKEMTKNLMSGDIPKEDIESIQKILENMGYHKRTILDEYHAYIISESKESIKKHLKVNSKYKSYNMVKTYFKRYDTYKRIELENRFFYENIRNGGHPHTSRHREDIEC